MNSSKGPQVIILKSLDEFSLYYSINLQEIDILISHLFTLLILRRVLQITEYFISGENQTITIFLVF